MKRSDNWQDRDDNRRPTPERLAKGTFELRDSEDAGQRFAVDTSGDTLGRLLASGHITPRQEEAGRCFERVARPVLGSPSQRSCLDFAPVGYDGDEPTDDEIRAQREWRTWCTMFNYPTWLELIRVCWENELPRNMATLRVGLDIAGDLAGLANETP